MKNLDKQLLDLYKTLPIPHPGVALKKEALARASEVFEQELVKNKKKAQGSPSEDRFMSKISITIQKLLLGGQEMTKRYALIGTAALAIMIGVTVHQQQKSLLTPPVILTEAVSDQKISLNISEPEKSRKQKFSIADKEESDGQKTSTVTVSVPTLAPAKLAETTGATSPARSAARKMMTNNVHSRTTAMPQTYKLRTDLGRVMDRDQRFYDSHDQYDGRDTFEKFSANSIKAVSDEPLSTFSIDVDTASYAFLRRSLKNGLLPQKNAIRVEELVNYFAYDYAVPTEKDQPFKPTVGIYQTPWNPQSKIIHIGIKAYDLINQEKPAANLVFLLDVSGSMSSPDKLPLLKNSLRMLVETLDKKDTVAIVVYAGATGVVLEPTSVAKKGNITAALDQLQSGGSTAGGAGIRLAYNLAKAHFNKNGINRVILATDGDFNVGISNQEELKSFIEKQRKSGITLSVLGFGQGNYNDSLMQALAQNGNGNAAYIDTLSEARKVLVDEVSSTLFTIATDVKIQVEFNPNMVSEYRLIGYETRALNKDDFNNDKVDAGDIGSGHSVTALYEITPAGSKDKLIDQLRYRQREETVPATTNNTSEYGFLKIRYKLPGETVSKRMTMPIDRGHEYGTINKAPGKMRFATAVAAFGQIVRNDPFTKGFTLDDVLSLANSAKGPDLYGYRSEFINLVRLAKTARGM